MFFQLPKEIIKEIYEYDNTYHLIYKKCMEQVKKVTKKYRVRFSDSVIKNYNMLQFSKKKIWNFTKNIEWRKKEHSIFGTFVYYNIYLDNVWDINPIITTYINYHCTCEDCNKTYIDYLKIKLLYI